MNKKIKPEDQFSLAFRDAFSGWIERVEKARGMTDGFPDLVALLPSGILPIELKVGSVIDGILWSDEVRPSQIRWHHNFSTHGGTSIFVVGVWSGNEWQAYAFDGMLARFWESTGFKIGDVAYQLDMSNLNESLTNFLFDQLGV